MSYVKTNSAAWKAGEALGELAYDFASRLQRSLRRQDAILDAYIESGRTGEPYRTPPDDGGR